MGRLRRAHLIEGATFLLIVVVFYGYSFEFNREIEIYRFGATAWPRWVIFLLLVATLGNLFSQYKHGSAAQEGHSGLAETDDGLDLSDRSAVMKIITVFFTPLIFAGLLKPVGIYFSAPFFIAAIMWLFGEHRWKSILIMTAIIYIIFIGLFLVVLNAPLPQGNAPPFYDFSAWILKMNAKLQGLWS